MIFPQPLLLFSVLTLIGSSFSINQHPKRSDVHQERFLRSGYPANPDNKKRHPAPYYPGPSGYPGDYGPPGYPGPSGYPDDYRPPGYPRPSGYPGNPDNYRPFPASGYPRPSGYPGYYQPSGYPDGNPYGAPGPNPQKGSSTRATATQTSSASQTSSAASSTSTSHRGSGDPCGPTADQTDFESTLNTCGQINTTYTHAPSVYGVQCLNANPSLNQHINLASCASNIQDLCHTILLGAEAVSQWTWSSGGPNCTVGIWVNPDPAGQPARSVHDCEDNIYSLMQSTCFDTQDGQFNVAAVNLETLPSTSTNGSQVDSGYPSYIIVPQTFDDTGDGDD